MSTNFTRYNCVTHWARTPDSNCFSFLFYRRFTFFFLGFRFSQSLMIWCTHRLFKNSFNFGEIVSFENRFFWESFPISLTCFSEICFSKYEPSFWIQRKLLIRLMMQHIVAHRLRVSIDRSWIFCAISVNSKLIRNATILKSALLRTSVRVVVMLSHSSCRLSVFYWRLRQSTLNNAVCLRRIDPIAISS